MGLRPMPESASESESFSEILLLQYFDGVSIPVTFTMLVPEMHIVSGSFIDWLSNRPVQALYRPTIWSPKWSAIKVVVC